MGSSSYRAQLRIGRFPRIDLLSAGSQQLYNSADRTLEYKKEMIYLIRSSWCLVKVASKFISLLGPSPSTH